MTPVTESTLRYIEAAKKAGNFILKHSVGNLPGDSEIDVPLTYADYYFIEALMRLRKLENTRLYDSN